MNKFVYIMRGIPGSGKSTVAREIAQAYPGHANRDGSQWFKDYKIHSTDDLCVVDGKYRFDPALADERHTQNFLNFLGSLKAGVKCIIVDNTNVKVQYYGHYVTAAKDAGYLVAIVELVHPTLDLAVARNTHGVPRDIINQMILDWEPSQHCVTVARVKEAWETVCLLQSRTRNYVLIALGVGGIAASVFIWLVLL